MKKTTKKTARSSKAKRDPNRYPKGWDRTRTESVIAHYANQTEDHAIAEDEAAFNNPGSVMMQVPNELVPAMRKLIAKRAG